MKAKKPVLWTHILHINGSIGPIVSKIIGFTHVLTHNQPCEFHETWFKTATYIVTVIIIKSWKSGSTIFECELKNIHEISLLESIRIRKKILWRINFVFIKYLLNAFLFEESRNKCKNPSFLHKTTRNEWDHGTTKMRCCLSTFMTWNYRGVWYRELREDKRV